MSNSILEKNTDIVRYAAQQEIIHGALRNPQRPDEDRSQDNNRKPAEIMQFCDIKAGMTVLDFQSGSGYYTEILSRVVGANGHVIAHNHSRDGVIKEQVFESRHGNNRLPNTELIFGKHHELELSEASIDLVLMSMVYHDTYYHRSGVDWGPVNQAQLLGSISAALKPRATLCLIDHHGKPGVEPQESALGVHRIDINRVKEDFSRAGYLLIKESAVLRNEDDDLSLSIFDQKVLGRTDRFVLLFNGPEK